MSKISTVKLKGEIVSLNILKKLGCEIYFMKKNISNKLNLKEIMKKILFININNILVEAGGIFFTNLLNVKISLFKFIYPLLCAQ